jgi:DNA-binding NarL/FixJ family response regulator
MADRDVLDRARQHFQEHSWREAHSCFEEADRRERLDAADLELYARAAYLAGRDDDCVRGLERAFHLRSDHDEVLSAAEDAFWLAYNLMNRGETAAAGGWLARSQELVSIAGDEHHVHGLLLVPPALMRLMEGDAPGALAMFREARGLGRRCRNPELSALAGLGVGQSQIALGETREGLATLDGVMVAVTSGEVSPIVSGLVYCAVIVACHDTFDLSRAAEWTRALSRWCEQQPDLVPFRGQCLVHRAQILTLHGAWTEAVLQVNLARERLSDPPGQPAVGMALYERGELHRLRGEYAAAEEAYRQAGRCGHEVQPGFALLRLARGEVEAARSGLRRALDETPGRGVGRPHLLAAYVEVTLATDDVEQARAAADELAGIAAAHGTAALRAMSAQATGVTLLAEANPRGALESLRRACALWRDLHAPYRDARVRVLLGLACRELEDHDAAQMELDAAAETFRELGAGRDLADLARLGVRPAATAPGRLTAREVEVLRAVATGKSNRAVADELFLSEKTVARHLSNIFGKLDVSSRAAATAYAYEHDLA